jgi:hypothetical protein
MNASPASFQSEELAHWTAYFLLMDELREHLRTPH